MNRNLLIIVGTVAIVGIVVGTTAYLISNSRTAPTNNSADAPGFNATAPTSVNNSQTTSAGTVVSPNGVNIPVKNFLQASTTQSVQSNPGHYDLGPQASGGVFAQTATSGQPYIIEYDSTTQSFTIALLQEPIEAVRQDMEQFLIGQLGISQADMCRLNYMVSVPDYVNQFYAGKNLGFSFCPGATQLPK